MGFNFIIEVPGPDGDVIDIAVFCEDGSEIVSVIGIIPNIFYIREGNCAAKIGNELGMGEGDSAQVIGSFSAVDTIHNGLDGGVGEGY